MQEDGALTSDERTELERLRIEVASLRAEAKAERAARATVPPGRAARGRWRTLVAVLLIVVGCLLAPVSMVAVWLRNQVTDTDRYLATVAPLADDPAIQDAVADQITTQIFNALDVEGFTIQVADALAARELTPRLADALHALAVPIADGVRNFTQTKVDEIVASDAFADAWVQANRQAHEELVLVMTGEGGRAVSAEDDTVSINLAAFIQTVKDRLVASGFDLAARIPEVNVSFVLFESANITLLRAGFDLLTVVGTWLPALVLALIAIGVYVAKDHRRALLGAGLGVAAGMLVLALGLLVFRAVYLDGLPDEILPDAAAAVLYDTIVRFLKLGLRTVFVLALVIAGGAFLSGQSVTAVRTRQGLTGAIAMLRGGAEHAGLRTGRVGTWVYANKQVLRVMAVVVSVLGLVFWDRPTGRDIIVLTGLLLVAVALIEFLGRPPPEPEPVPGPAA